MHAAHLHTIEASLQTGDLLLFSGKGFASAGIKWLLGCTWSHVGLVVRSANHGQQALLWEATPCRALADLVSGHAAGGTRLVSLRARLASFPGAVALRRLSKPLEPTQEERLAATLWELHGRPYERSWLELILAVPDRIGLDRENLTSLFCSELVAETYQRIGLLDEHAQGGLPSNEYTPRHFSAAHHLPLKQGFALGPEIRLDGADQDPELALAA